MDGDIFLAIKRELQKEEEAIKNHLAQGMAKDWTEYNKVVGKMEMLKILNTIISDMQKRFVED
jgi:hypothetical protein